MKQEKLVELIAEAARRCNDIDLLDLIYKLLLSGETDQQLVDEVSLLGFDL